MIQQLVSIFIFLPLDPSTQKGRTTIPQNNHPQRKKSQQKSTNTTTILPTLLSRNSNSNSNSKNKSRQISTTKQKDFFLPTTTHAALSPPYYAF
ncbi:uncharacterized protein K452DRAFT_149242 [Aplosporella prunicola CBS 121167]|uniref:Uncharacterized protein n=1 Tax=Aplosporella prunicola CBS 121167 TaxID=1176127 RepID=A0A6A6AYE7_9PEZI|nr:uncharacterized protein K452DRAFT_149242 [Aplosporella prunicola CBS 121167]KAF2136014.1 hypothetical protein K452DRAFT_149242 [Aplosporella prunicola CBS 121167]